MSEMLLPAQINANGLLPFIAQLGSLESEDEIELDFTALRRVTPAGLAALGAAVHRWKKTVAACFSEGSPGVRSPDTSSGWICFACVAWICRKAPGGTMQRDGSCH
jgi:hypothetical protein